MTARTITNSRLVDGAKLDNLPADTNASLALKADVADLNAKEDKANKGQPNGYAPLDASGKVPLANLPAGGWTGDVVWPSSSTDNALARFDATTGKLIQNGTVTESDNGDLSSVNALTLDVTPTSVPTAVGTLSWNPDEDTMDIRQGSSILQVGQEQQWNVRNNTASTITEGTPVYVTGTIGASGRMTVAPFIANGSIPSMYYVGIMTENVLPGSDGKATTFGKIRQINTSMWNNGDVLYCSPTVAGQLTNVQPSTPAYVIPTAFVIHSATNGTIAVRVPTLHEADEVKYSNAVSLLTASNLQDAVDELNFEKVNKNTTINGYSLATNVALTASDVGAPSGSGTSTGTNTGDQDLSGLVPYTGAVSDVNLGAKTVTAAKFNNVALTSGWAGSLYLANDGTYKAVSGWASFQVEGSFNGELVNGQIFRVLMKGTGTLTGFKAKAGTASAGASIKIDVRKNTNVATSSIFTSDLPLEIVAGSTALVTGTAIDNGTWADGDVVLVVVTQIGSTVSGADVSWILY